MQQPNGRTPIKREILEISCGLGSKRNFKWPPWNEEDPAKRATLLQLAD